MNTTVMLIDDHAIMRMGLKSLLDTYADIKVVADAEGGEETVRTALAKKPDVIVMDLMMPIMDGTESTRRILAEWPDAKILILTTYGTADAIGHTLEAGAKGAMMKNAELDELVAAIKKVARGERFIDAEISQMLSENPRLLLPRFALRRVKIDLVARAEGRVGLRHDLGELRKEPDGDRDAGGSAKIDLDLRAVRIGDFEENGKTPGALYHGLPDAHRLVGKPRVIVLEPNPKPRRKLRKGVGKRSRLANGEVQVSDFWMPLVELVVLAVVDAVGDFAGEHYELVYA